MKDFDKNAYDWGPVSFSQAMALVNVNEIKGTFQFWMFDMASGHHTHASCDFDAVELESGLVLGVASQWVLGYYREDPIEGATPLFLVGTPKKEDNETD